MSIAPSVARSCGVSSASRLLNGLRSRGGNIAGGGRRTTATAGGDGRGRKGKSKKEKVHSKVRRRPRREALRMLFTWIQRSSAGLLSSSRLRCCPVKWDLPCCQPRKMNTPRVLGEESYMVNIDAGCLGWSPRARRRNDYTPPSCYWLTRRHFLVYCSFEYHKVNKLGRREWTS